MSAQLHQAFCFCFITTTVAQSFLPFGPHEYYFGGKVRSYEKAEYECEYRNASLAIVDTKEIRDFLVSRISVIGYPYSFYIGLRRISNSSNNSDAFQWINGTSLSSTYENWYTFEPNNNGGNERCVIMGWIYEFDADYKWRDVECNRTSRFVCQSSDIANETSRTPVTSGPGYSYNFTRQDNFTFETAENTNTAMVISEVSSIVSTTESTTKAYESTTFQDNTPSPTAVYFGPVIVNTPATSSSTENEESYTSSLSTATYGDKFTERETSSIVSESTTAKSTMTSSMTTSHVSSVLTATKETTIAAQCSAPAETIISIFFGITILLCCGVIAALLWQRNGHRIKIQALEHKLKTKGITYQLPSNSGKQDENYLEPLPNSDPHKYEKMNYDTTGQSSYVNISMEERKENDYDL